LGLRYRLRRSGNDTLRLNGRWSMAMTFVYTSKVVVSIPEHLYSSVAVHIASTTFNALEK
jgi:hypothetical protein